MLRLAALVLGWAVAGGSAFGQRIEVQPSDAQRCLTVVAGAPAQPTYPREQLQAGRSSQVKVRLRFSSPDSAPQAEVLSTGGQEFDDVVLEHASRLRVPCMAANSPRVSLIQHYHFFPDDDRVWADLFDEDADSRSKRVSSCVVHESGSGHPPYPLRAQQEGIQGRVWLNLRFEARGKASRSAVYARPNARALSRAIETWALGFRLDCDLQEPVNVDVQFTFRFGGDDRYGFRPLTLGQWVGSSVDVRRNGLQMDLTRTGCPFSVQVTYLQPLLPNRVRQIGPPDPRREPFLAWLRNSVLSITEAQRDAVFGDDVRLDVPCTSYDIPPPAPQR
jgi:hypothetical protein